MRSKLAVISIMVTVFMLSCRQKETEQQDIQQQKQESSSVEPRPQSSSAGNHTVVVEEVIHASSYTYLRVKEGGLSFWMAIRKREMEVGETISFANGAEMRNFTSKDLQRTFETIYFVGSISKQSSGAAQNEPVVSPHGAKPAVVNKNISIEPSEGGVSIGELLTNKEVYANKIIRIKGQVVKVNLAIMGKNWVHLQDGTGNSGSNDLTVTTQDKVNVGDTVTFEGMIVLDKDFGAGYAYALLMEDAKKKTD